MAFGVFSEQSFPLDPASIVRVQADAAAGKSVRAWLEVTHDALKGLLPTGGTHALLTADLIDDRGRAVDVCQRFGLNPAGLGSLRTNWRGLAHTAQASSAGREGEAASDSWPGFDDIWVPGHDGLPLAGRFGASTDDSGIRNADAIVILPGLLGDNRVMRTRDLAAGLQRWGFHVLALEPRGHGATDQRTPQAAYTFSSLETLDLLAVSRWLRGQPHVQRTGLIGFCWGANHALCAAWYDGCRGEHCSIHPRLAALLDPTPSDRHFDAGVMAFSPVLRFEDLLDKLDTKRSLIREPALAGLQATIRERMTRKGYPDPSGSLRHLIACELQRSRLANPDVEPDAYRFVRMLPYRDQSDGEKLQSARVPVLIIHAANDPLADAQAVADLFEKISNPSVAGIVLAGGGHVGFAPYARDYYYSLVANFFSSDSAPAAAHLLPRSLQ
jgi:predicted alpha/beta-fold hydrolase